MRFATHFKFNKAQLAIVFALGLSFVSLQNCSNVGFAHSDSSGDGDNTKKDVTTPPVNTCQETQLQQITTPVKILLVVDMSGSNAGGYDDQGIYHYGTDPQKRMRGGSIQAFFNDFAGKTNFSWGFITFAGLSATAILNHNNNPSSPAFTASTSTMQSAINYFYNTDDDGQTPYKSAISLATAAIQNDTSDTAQTKYIVVFLSDGLPSDYDFGTAGDNAIKADVSALVNLRAGRISFSTVYYGPADAAASGRLHMMANTGGGQFLDTNANPAAKDFLINNVVTVPGTTCPTN